MGAAENFFCIKSLALNMVMEEIIIGSWSVNRMSTSTWSPNVDCDTIFGPDHFLNVSSDQSSSPPRDPAALGFQNDGTEKDERVLEWWEPLVVTPMYININNNTTSTECLRQRGLKNIRK